MGQPFADSLTQVYNRLFFDEVLRREVERANRYQSEFSILFVDVDQLEQLNRRGGKAMGDQCLKRLAAVVMGAVRAGDIVARHGGDEFVILLDHCRPLDAIQCAHRILERLAEAPGECRFTVSIGLMHYEGVQQVSRPEQLLSHAVHATSQAKRQGGNCLGIAV